MDVFVGHTVAVCSDQMCMVWAQTERMSLQLEAIMSLLQNQAADGKP